MDVEIWLVKKIRKETKSVIWELTLTSKKAALRQQKWYRNILIERNEAHEYSIVIEKED